MYIKKSGTKKTLEDAKKEFQKMGLTLDKNEIYKNFETKMKAYTTEGYIVYTTLAKVRKGSKPKIFSISNPSTIRNIRDVWLPLNAPEYDLVSNEFKGTHEKMGWRLKTGELPNFHMTWGGFQTQRRHPKIGIKQISVNQRLSIEKVKKDIEETLKSNSIYDGWSLVEGEVLNYKNDCSQLKFEHKDGYRSISTYTRIVRQHSSIPLFWMSYPETSTENMYIWINNNETEYALKSNQTYTGADNKYVFICKTHGEFEMSWTNIREMKGCRKCHFEKLSMLFSGEGSPYWDHSKSEDERLLGRSVEGYSQWRQGVYKRDGRICQSCGCYCEPFNIAAHHKDGYHWCEERRLDIDNGVTLCNNCHRGSVHSFHTIYGNKNNTEHQFKEWLLKYGNILTKERKEMQKVELFLNS